MNRKKYMDRNLIVWVGVIATALVSPAAAQSFNQFVGFGDSTIDSGYFRYVDRQNGTEPRYALARANGGAITPSAGLMVSDYLAAAFGLTAIPSSAPDGGTNYAVSGARMTLANTGGGTSPSIVAQIDAYLNSTGRVANPNAIYLISGGGNDLTTMIPLSQPAFAAAITPIATQYVAAITELSRAGARYIIVPNYGSSNLRPTQLSQGIWNALASSGVNFIPADYNSLLQTILANPERFGFTSATPTVLGGSAQTSACHTPTGFNNAGAAAYALYCIPNTTPVGGTAYLNAANSLQTSLYSDDQHLTPAGQKIVSDYYYSLIVAPSQISFLAESAIQGRRGTIQGIQQQIDLSQRNAKPGFNVWFTGDTSYLKLDNNSPGFPNDPATPVGGTLGINYRWSDALIGGAVSLGGQRSTFSSGGRFDQNEIAGHIYAAARHGLLWGSIVGTYGSLKYDVNRAVVLGPTFENNKGTTRGQNASAAGMIGLDNYWDTNVGRLRHGPVAGFEVQSANVNSFIESGSFTSLAFGKTGRESYVSAVGYRASLQLQKFQPFAQLTYNHEFANLDYQVTAKLLSVQAPSYQMPAVQLGRDWATATLGTSFDLGTNLTGLASVTAFAARTHVTNYAGRLGINYAFGEEQRPVVPR